MLAERDDLGLQKRVLGMLEDAYGAQRIKVESTWSSRAELVDAQASYGILTSVLLGMVVLTATVGSIGLMSTMSMNVVERRREIGVMRAIGASSLAIVAMFVVEGMLVGALSWLLAAPLSYPASRVFGDVIGQAVFAMPLEFVYAADGMLAWLLIVSILSAVASFWPALRATRISVRQALAYE
jgi:putative ABC transport system permease protein